MNKKELVDFIAGETGLSKVASQKALEAFVDGVIAGLKENDKVSITGFCTFAVKDRPAKEGRNPRTGEKLIIPARKAITIKPGSKLKEALN